MAWGLSSWLGFTRSIQLVGAFACAAMNGCLIAFMYGHGIGASRLAISLEWTICVLLVYTALLLLVLHTRQRSSKASWLVTSIVTDVLFMGDILASITLLAQAGVPSQCGGLSASTADPSQSTWQGYIGSGFADEASPHQGTLNRLCILEQSFYFVAVAILFSYTITIVLTVLQICSSKYTANRRVYNTMDTLHRERSGFSEADKLEDGQQVPLENLQVQPSPPSEGIMSARTSVRIPRSSSPTPISPRIRPSTRALPTRSTQSPYHVTQTIMPTIPARKPIPPSLPARPSSRQQQQQQQEQQQQPRRDSVVASSSRTDYAGMSSTSTSATTGNRTSVDDSPLLVPGMVSDDSGEQAAAAAMITDGLRFEGGYLPGNPVLPPYSLGRPSNVDSFEYGDKR